MTAPAAFVVVERCRGCHARALREVLRMEPMPLAGQFCVTSAEAKSAVRYPLTWIQCQSCGLVQVAEDVDDRVMFGQYNYSSSSVPGLVRHFESYSAWLRARLGENERRQVLEIGCNDGVLLSRLPRTWRRVGVDPSDVTGRVDPRAFEVVPAPFSAELAGQIEGSGDFDLVTGSNCLAHIHDLNDVFEGVARLLKPGGLFVVEVHDLAATLEGGQWDTIYHEHKAEWSIDSLRNCLRPLGFRFEAVEHLPLHGGLLRAVFSRGEPSQETSRVNEDFGELRRAYQGRRDTAVYRRLAEQFRAGKRVVAYGAAGRANVWLNQHPELAFEYIVDDAPLRMNKFIPCVATPIVPSSRVAAVPPDAILITAWNHARDIRGKHPAYAGEWLQTFDLSAGSGHA